MLNFKLAEEQHLPLVNELVNRAFRGDSSKKGWTTEADLLGGQRTDLESLKEFLTKRDHFILTGWLNNVLVCCASLYFENKVAFLGMITTHPEKQGQGLGKKLILFCEDWIQQKGIEKVQMTVIRQRTELIQFYLRRGYQETGITKPFPYGNEKFGIPKRQDLEFLVLEKNL